jgi:hypothetical protein
MLEQHWLKEHLIGAMRRLWCRPMTIRAGFVSEAITSTRYANTRELGAGE